MQDQGTGWAGRRELGCGQNCPREGGRCVGHGTHGRSRSRLWREPWGEVGDREQAAGSGSHLVDTEEPNYET